jgi:putative aldouronate transport system substrate-binding protein
MNKKIFSPLGKFAGFYADVIRIVYFHRRRNMKKFLFLSAGLLIAALAFAGGGGQTQAGGPVDYGKRTTGPNYWMVKSAAPVTIHAVNWERPNTPFAPGDDPTKNEWTRGLKKYLNVDIVTDWLSTTQGYMEKVNLAIASGELPDVFRVNPTQFRQLVEAGLAADITDYVENNLSDVMKNIMAAAPAVTESAKVNGRLMGLPRYGYGDLWMVDDLWIRKDWMEQTKLGAPKSIADLEKIMDAFMAQHPGSYGMPLTKDLYEVWYLAAAFNAAPNIWVDGPGGSIVYGTVQPAMKSLIALFADWYKRGYLRKDFMSQDGAARVDDVTAGKVGIVLGENHVGWQYTDLIKANGPNAYLEPYEIPTIDGKPGIFPIGFDNEDYIVINAKSKNIAMILKCISFTSWVIMEATMQGAMTDADVYKYLLGGEGRHDLSFIEVNDPWGNGPVLVDWAREIGRNNFEIKSPALSAEWMSHYEAAKLWHDSKNIEGYGRWIQQYAPRNAASINLNIIREKRYVANRLTGPLPEEAVSYGSTLDDLLVEGFTKIITGEQPLSYFDTLAAEWKSAGGDVITAAVNRVYGKK